MIRFEAEGSQHFLIINWEWDNKPGGAFEIIIAPAQLPYRVDAKGIATWSQPDQVAATVVETSGLRTGLEAVCNAEPLVLPLPVVPGCESRLILRSTPEVGMVDVQIAELYPPFLDLTVRVRVADVLTKLFAGV